MKQIAPEMSKGYIMFMKISKELEKIKNNLIADFNFDTIVLDKNIIDELLLNEFIEQNVVKKSKIEDFEKIFNLKIKTKNQFLDMISDEFVKSSKYNPECNIFLMKYTNIIYDNFVCNIEKNANEFIKNARIKFNNIYRIDIS